MTDETIRPSADPELRRLAELVRAGNADLDTEVDLGQIWSGVQAELAGDAAAPAPRPEVAAVAAAPVADIAVRRRSLPLGILGAAAALVVGLAAGVVLNDRFGAAPEVELAAAALAPLVDGVEPSTATLREVDGTRVVELDLSELPDPTGYYEVWLLDEGVTQLVSLGPARPDGTYVVPDGVDVVGVPSVDVSRELADGDPSHGGDSILRGTFTW